MIGSCCAAMISVGFGVEALSIGVGGLPGILSIKPEYWGLFLLAMAVAIIVPFTLTFIVGRIKLSKEDRFGKENAAPAIESAEDAEAVENSTGSRQNRFCSSFQYRRSGCKRTEINS